jgi:hypothetical protein
VDAVLDLADLIDEYRFEAAIAIALLAERRVLRERDGATHAPPHPGGVRPPRGWEGKAGAV